MSNPLATPSSSTAGGANANTIASRSFENAPHRAAGDRLHGVVGARSLLPVLEPHERNRHSAAAGKRKAGHGEQRLYGPSCMKCSTSRSTASVRSRACSCGQHDLREQDALILVGRNAR
jgi:hypothetical protein